MGGNQLKTHMITDPNKENSKTVRPQLLEREP